MYTVQALVELATNVEGTITVIFDHGNRTPTELAADVMHLAFANGWNDGEAAELLEVYYDPDLALPGVWSTYDTVDEAMSDAAFDATDSAEEYLNDYLAQFHPEAEGIYFHNDGYLGAFVLGPIVED